ncbi:hypothetical protein [Limnohabitans sp.]|uniref:hypothetical protein n=1 Tax=Limnohabitans sp. TaxID=1907725 RepID=UPI00286FA6D6|nr:hypothetical protein [Limnohabitans sp.]
MQIGRAQKFTDFVLVEDDALGLTRRLVDASYARTVLDLLQANTSSTSVLYEQGQAQVPELLSAQDATQ